MNIYCSLYWDIPVPTVLVGNSFNRYIKLTVTGTVHTVLLVEFLS